MSDHSTAIHERDRVSFVRGRFPGADAVSKSLGMIEKTSQKNLTVGASLRPPRADVGGHLLAAMINRSNLYSGIGARGPIFFMTKLLDFWATVQYSSRNGTD